MKKFDPVLLTVLVISLLFSCGKREQKVLVGHYRGEPIYAQSKEPLTVMEAVEKVLIDLDQFKEREAKKYQEVLQSAKEVALYNREIIGKIKDFKKEYVKTIPYNYTIQHIFHTDRAVIQDLMLRKEQLKDFDSFAALAKEYSMETGTKNRQGLLAEINLSTQKVSSHFFYQLHDKPIEEPFILRDPFGYHIIKILKKGDHDVSKLLENKNALNRGIMDYRKYLFFEELKEKYGVEYYSVNYMDFFSKGPETPLYKIADRIVTKQDLLDQMRPEQKDNPFLQAKISMSTVAPIIEEYVQKSLASMEAATLPVDKIITEIADREFIREILAVWYETMMAQTQPDDLPEEKMLTLYKKENFQDVESTRFALIMSPTAAAAEMLARELTTEKQYKDFTAKWSNRVRFSPFMSEGQVYGDFKDLASYLDTPVGTILPVMNWKGNYVLPMTWEKQVAKEIPWETYKNRFKVTVQNMRLYEKVLSHWETIEELEIEAEILAGYRTLINTMKRATIERLEEIDNAE